MIVVTTNEISGKSIKEYKGMVKGLIVRAPTIGQGVLGGLKSIVGGKVGSYTQMCEQARLHAYELMVEHANQMGANAIIGVRFDSSDLGGESMSTEVLCYGTAVVVS